MSFAKEMLMVQEQLEQNGHVCILPHETDEFVKGTVRKSEDAAFRKIHYDLIRRHYEKIKESDAVLVLNIYKNGMKDYIGANTFLEMGFAFVLGKAIFLLNPLPDNPYLRAEAEAMMPIVLHGNLQIIGEGHATTL